MSGPRDIVLSPDEQALKLAFRALVRAFGGQEAVAAEVGRAQSRISDWCSAHTRDFAPLDVVARLEGCTIGLPGAPHVSAACARVTGHVLVRLPDRPAEAGGLLAMLGRQGQKYAALSATLIDALGDGRLRRDEALAVREQIARLIPLLATMDAELADVIDGGGE